MARLANLLCVINPRLMEKGRKAAHYNQAASWVSRCSSGAKPFKCRIIRLIYACWRRASYWRCPTCGMHDPVSGRSSVYQGHPCFRPVVPLQLRVEEGSMRILVIALFSTALSGIMPYGWASAALSDRYGIADTVLSSGYVPGDANSAPQSSVEPPPMPSVDSSNLTIEPPAPPSLNFMIDPVPMTDLAKEPSTLDETALGTIDFDVPTVRARNVDRDVRYFSYRIRDRFEQWLGRLERYRPTVENIFAEFKLALDLVFLSLVESGFNTNAVSRAKAVGPWQFMKPTAKMYGLRVDSWVDERRDPVKSTLAAAQYLRDLYHLFGSWPLAMAAYNAGERKVGRALIRARADDFWDLTDTKLLKRETREYVPRFLAATLIAKDPSRYGFMLSPQPPVEYEEAVLTRPIHLRMAAKAAGATYQELKALNPELRRDLTPPDPIYRLKVPVGSKDLLLSNLASYPDWKRVQATRYTVRRGETLHHIATRHHTPLSAILEANALDKSSKLKPGEWLLIPQPVFKAKS